MRPYTPSGGDFTEDLDRVDAKADKWGLMPPKMRDDVKQAETVGEIPKYHSAIVEYMKRLSEKN